MVDDGRHGHRHRAQQRGDRTNGSVSYENDSGCSASTIDGASLTTHAEVAAVGRVAGQRHDGQAFASSARCAAGTSRAGPSPVRCRRVVSRWSARSVLSGVRRAARGRLEIDRRDGERDRPGSRAVQRARRRPAAAPSDDTVSRARTSAPLHTMHESELDIVLDHRAAPADRVPTGGRPVPTARPCSISRAGSLHGSSADRCPGTTPACRCRRSARVPTQPRTLPGRRAISAG